MATCSTLNDTGPPATASAKPLPVSKLLTMPKVRQVVSIYGTLTLAGIAFTALFSLVSCLTIASNVGPLTKRLMEGRLDGCFHGRAGTVGSTHRHGPLLARHWLCDGTISRIPCLASIFGQFRTSQGYCALLCMDVCAFADGHPSGTATLQYGRVRRSFFGTECLRVSLLLCMLARKRLKPTIRRQHCKHVLKLPDDPVSRHLMLDVHGCFLSCNSSCARFRVNQSAPSQDSLATMNGIVQVGLACTPSA